MLLLGGGVKGGKVYGKWPGLDASHLYENRDLAVTTDFRDVFAEVLAKRMGVANLAPVFPGYDCTERQAARGHRLSNSPCRSPTMTAVAGRALRSREAELIPDPPPRRPDALAGNYTTCCPPPAPRSLQARSRNSKRAVGSGVTPASTGDPRWIGGSGFPPGLAAASGRVHRRYRSPSTR